MSRKRRSHPRAEEFRSRIPTASASTGQQETRWKGASRVIRSLTAWNPATGSGTSDLPSSEQRTLRARSRDAFRGNPIARAALTRSKTSIVGTGLMARPSVDHVALGITPESAEAINADLQRRWEVWAENPAYCDAEATMDIYGLQSLALLSAMLSGDVFAITPQVDIDPGVASLKIQLVEADRVSNKDDAQNTTSMIDGVRLNGVRPVSYFIRSTHPGDTSTDAALPTWTEYPIFGAETGRRRVLHVWNDKERPGQVRGAPFLAPILEPLKQLERWSQAKLMSAVVDTLLTVFIQKEKEQYDSSGNPLGAFDGSADFTAETDSAPAQISLGEGAIVDLAPGEKPVQTGRNSVDSNVDQFFGAWVKQIGAAIEIPVDELLLHYQASYSAARAAMLQAWRFYLLRRWTLVQQFCAPIYGLWLDEEVASGRVSLQGYADPLRRAAWSRCLWIGPAKGAMDEEKEARAAQARIEAGLSNKTIETAALTGEDWKTTNAQRLIEIEQEARNDPA